METEMVDGETGANKFSILKSPRIMKSHLPYELWKDQLEKHPDLKVSEPQWPNGFLSRRPWFYLRKGGDNGQC